MEMATLSSASMMQHSAITWLSTNFRTQNWMVDVLLIMCISALFSAIVAWYHSGRDTAAGWVSALVERVLHALGIIRQPYSLLVEHNTIVNKYGDENSYACSHDNQYLVSALFLYAEHLQCLEEAKVHMKSGGGTITNRYDSMKSKYVSLRAIASRIHVNEDIFLDVHLESDQGNEKVGRTSSSKVEIQSWSSFEACRTFAREAYDFFVEQDYKKYDAEDEQKKLKYYSVRSIDHDAGQITWNQYYLGTQRGFDYLYFDEKEATLKLIDNFTNKSAQFAIGGPAYKLGFLLYGVPGCGKTSFIKALANYTQRHIIDLHLSKFAKNSELRDAFFQQNIMYKHGTSTDNVTIPLDKRIIIMEDIDALSDIVSRRSDTDTWNDKDFAKLTPDIKEGAEGSEQGDGEDGEAASSPKDDGEGEEEVGSSKKDKKSAKEEKKSAIEKYLEKMEGLEDRVNLAALLSILDGTLELTGPIIIMTTNLPERLDPALIRSGRITKHIYFGRMSMQSIVDMLHFYFQDRIVARAFRGDATSDGVGRDSLTGSLEGSRESLLRSSGACFDFLLDPEPDAEPPTTEEFREKYAPLYRRIRGFERLHRKIAPNDLEAICRNSIDVKDCCAALNEFIQNLEGE